MLSGTMRLSIPCRAVAFALAAFVVGGCNEDLGLGVPLVTDLASPSALDATVAPFDGAPPPADVAMAPPDLVAPRSDAAGDGALASPDLATPDAAIPDLATTMDSAMTMDLAVPVDLSRPDLLRPVDLVPSVDLFPAACANKMLDGKETDVDCGGGECPGCALVLVCKVNGDCRSGVCNAGRCARSLSFRAAPGSSAGFVPGSLAVGDFDRDGLLDVVAATSQPTEDLAFFRGLGQGRLAAAKAGLAGGGGGPTVTTGDLDGDGRADVVTANGTGKSLSVLLGDVKGGFAAPAVYPDISACRKARVADLNGDGRLDVVVTLTTRNTGSVAVYLNQGGGALALAGTTPINTVPMDLVVADLDNDGDLDVLVVHSTQFFLMKNDGKGRLAAPAQFLLFGLFDSLIAGDWTGDGKLDLLGVDNGSSKVTLAPGDGRGAFGVPKTFDVGWSPLRAAGGDLDGDGRLDVAVVNNMGSSVTLLFGDGKGGLGDRSDFATDDSPSDVVIADLDGDGAQDVVVAAGDGVDVLRGDGKRGMWAARADVPGGSRVALADLDLDGALDAVASGGNYNEVFVYRWAVDRFQPPIRHPGGSYNLGIGLFDADSDGKLDVVTTDLQGTATVLFGLGNAMFKPALVQKTGSTFGPAAFGDLDRDGDIDALGQGDVLRNDGKGNFARVSRAAISAINALADLDGDGALDLVTGSNATLSVLLGNNDTTFGPPANQVIQGTLADIAIADVDNDGRLDVLAVGDMGLQVFTNLGKGMIGNGRLFATGLRGLALTVADFDGDKRIDAAVCGTTGTLAVLRGDGSGLGAPLAFRSVGRGCGNLVPGDLDGDGRIDLVSTTAAGLVELLSTATGR